MPFHSPPLSMSTDNSFAFFPHYQDAGAVIFCFMAVVRVLPILHGQQMSDSFCNFHNTAKKQQQYEELFIYRKTLSPNPYSLLHLALDPIRAFSFPRNMYLFVIKRYFDLIHAIGTTLVIKRRRKHCCQHWCAAKPTEEGPACQATHIKKTGGKCDE
jgi:hypothetical protein